MIGMIEASFSTAKVRRTKKARPKRAGFVLTFIDSKSNYRESFTWRRFSLRAFELAGRAPWLALLSFRLVLAIVPDPVH